MVYIVLPAHLLLDCIFLIKLIPLQFSSPDYSIKTSNQIKLFFSQLLPLQMP